MLGEVRGLGQEARRAVRWPNKPNGGELVVARFAADFHLKQSALDRAAVRLEGQQSLLAISEIEKGRREGRLHLAHPGGKASPDAGGSRLTLTGDQQPFRLAVERDDSPILADPAVQEETARTHDGLNPRPESRLWVS